MNSDKKRQRMIETALQLLLTEGYRPMSIERLALSIDMKKSNIYHYFPSKLAVAETALEALIDTGQSKLLAMAAEPNDQRNSQLAEFCEWYMRHLYGVLCLAREVKSNHQPTLVVVTQQYFQLLVLLTENILFNDAEIYQKPRLTYHFITDILGRFLAHKLYQGSPTIYYGEALTLDELLYQRCLAAMESSSSDARKQGH